MPPSNKTKAKLPVAVSSQSTVERENRKIRLLERLRLGEPWAAATRAVGVCERTATNWRKKDPEYAQAVDAARDAAIATVENKMYDLCLKDDSGYNALRIFYLKVKAGWKDQAGKSKRSSKRRTTVLPEVAEAAVTAGLKKHDALREARD